jgi:hypothetical protein
VAFDVLDMVIPGQSANDPQMNFPCWVASVPQLWEHQASRHTVQAGHVAPTTGEVVEEVEELAVGEFVDG